MELTFAGLRLSPGLAQTYELRPYGYVPIFSGANGKDVEQMTMYTYIYDNSVSTTTAVLQFAYQDKGCSSTDPVSVYDIGGTQADGYSFSDGFGLLLNSGLAPHGLWVTVAQN